VTPAPDRVAAVCFDLDDTLYPQSVWLHGAWGDVAARGAEAGVDERALRDALERIAAEASDGGGIIDRALAEVGARNVAVGPFVDAFRSHAPSVLEPYPGVREGLDHLGAALPLGIVSDGDPKVQRSKLTALGLGDAFRVVVWSDEHGRAHRKPDPLPFLTAVELLGTSPRDTVYVGDRPDKDVAGAIAAGLPVIRVRTGEWSARPDDPRAFASVPTVADAIAVLGDLVAAQLG